MRSGPTPLALTLFGVYLLLYGGFVLINAFAPKLMEWTPWAGVNLAVLYGFGLIISAIVLAAVYGVMSERRPSNGGRDREERA